MNQKQKYYTKNQIEKGLSGIYSLTFGGEVIYVGQSQDMRYRVNQHLNWRGRIQDRLRKGVRNSAQLMELERYQFIGEHFEGIGVKILEICPFGKLDDREKYWIRYYKPRFNWEGVRSPFKGQRRRYDKEEECAW